MHRKNLLRSWTHYGILEYPLDHVIFLSYFGPANIIEIMCCRFCCVVDHMLPSCVFHLVDYIAFAAIPLTLLPYLFWVHNRIDGFTAGLPLHNIFLETLRRRQDTHLHSNNRMNLLWANSVYSCTEFWVQGTLTRGQKKIICICSHPPSLLNIVRVLFWSLIIPAVFTSQFYHTSRKWVLFRIYTYI